MKKSIKNNKKKKKKKKAKNITLDQQSQVQTTGINTNLMCT